MQEKEWILLFEINERSWLQNELNRAIRDYDVTNIQVSFEDGKYFAILRYKGKSPQIDEKREENGQKD